MSTVPSPATLMMVSEGRPRPAEPHKPRPSLRSWWGLCATSFFLAESNGVTLPFINTYLADHGWSYDAIGLITGLTGLVCWIFNVPSGMLIEAVRRHHKLLLAIASIVAGVATGLFPHFTQSIVLTAALLTVAGLGRLFFIPVINALTLQLAGHHELSRALGVVQSWNHLGNIAAAVLAIGVVSLFAIESVFYSVAVVSILAALSMALMNSRDLAGETGPTPATETATGQIGTLLHDRAVLVLLIASLLFHLANAPVMPLVAQKIRHVGGSHTLVAAVVLVAQLVMIPAAYYAGILAPRWGRKPILAVGFLVLPLRNVLYALTDDPILLVGLQSLDGLGAGIFDVVSVAIVAQVTRQEGGFNTLMGMMGAAIGLGAVAGPFLSGVSVQYFGFTAAFGLFAVIAALAALVFVVGMPTDD